MSFFRSFRELRRLGRLAADEREIVFYSESAQDWHVFAPILDRLTKDAGRDGPAHRVCYVGSDPRDPGLSYDGLVGSFLVDSRLARMVLFQLLRADVLVLTMLDLGNFELKRSIYPVHYVYVFHSLGSTHMVDFANSYDHYDTILCAGPQHIAEIRRREEIAGLPQKELVEHGYARLEQLMVEARSRPARPEAPETPTVLIAPTWGPGMTLEACGLELVEVLLEAGFRVILRPHYQTVRLTPAVVERIRERFASHERFEYEDRMADTDSLFRSDLLVCDWSSTAIEYALGLEKPVLFVDVPRRVRNPDFAQLGLEPLEIEIRREVGDVLDPEAVAEAPERVRKLIAGRAALRDRLEELRARWVFNLGHSAEVAAAEIARIAQERVAARRGARPQAESAVG